MQWGHFKKRNAVAHRYSPIEIDQKSQITMDDPKKIILELIMTFQTTLMKLLLSNNHLKQSETSFQI